MTQYINWQENNGLYNEEWRWVKTYADYIWDDIYAAQVWRWLIIWATPVSWYWELITSWSVNNHLIWPLNWTPNLAVPPSPWVQMTIVSTSSDDDKDNWTWIRSMEIHYLDWNLDSQSETIELEWTVSVTTIATDIRFIQCMHISTYWDDKNAIWNITASNWWTIYSYIKAWDRRCASSARRVPRGKRFVLKALYWWSASWTAAASITIRLVTTFIEWHDYSEAALTIPQAAISAQDWSESLMLDMPISFPEWVIVAMEASWDKWAIINGGYIWYFENV